MLSRWARTWIPDRIRPLVAALIRAGVTPNGLTLAGLVMIGLAGVAIGMGQHVLGALGLLLSGIFDSLDGELARQGHFQSPLGPFIDSVADHYGDLAVYMGMAWWALQRNEQTLVILVLLAMFGTLIGSHIRSRAGMIGVDTRWAGLFTRAERTIVWIVGLLTGWVLPALIILALASNFSALQRLVYTLRAGRAKPQ
jgi:CDP-diacylglycerol--glycerol-3-phosphate 3-phosphatidyltransferase